MEAPKPLRIQNEHGESFLIEPIPLKERADFFNSKPSEELVRGYDYFCPQLGEYARPVGDGVFMFESRPGETFRPI